jgi:hypothetical protein
VRDRERTMGLPRRLLEKPTNQLRPANRTLCCWSSAPKNRSKAGRMATVACRTAARRWRRTSRRRVGVSASSAGQVEASIGSLQ